MVTRNPTGNAAPAIKAFRGGSIVRAERLARDALRESPDDLELLDVLWRCLAAQQSYREAAEHLRRLLELGGGDARYQVELGKLLRLGGDTAGAEAAFRLARQERPGDPEVTNYLVHLLRDRGKWAEARGLVVDQANGATDVEGRFQAALFLESVDAFEEAASNLESVLAANPGHANAHAVYSRVMETLGRFEEAHEHCRLALEGNPEFPGGWIRLTWMRKVADPEDPDLERLRAAAENPKLSTECRACARFALGKAFDDLGDRGEAFAQFIRGNGMWRSGHEWSTAAWDREVESVIRTFTGAPPARVERRPTPVFVVGMLRTGSTLLERLLARHSGIVARGEMTVLTNVFRKLPRPGWPEAYPRLGEEEKLHIRETYLERLVRDDSDAAAFIDKSPVNFRYLGVILELFPEAVIVHTRRDPRDVGLSLFFQPLVSSESAYAFDMDEIVHYYRGYRRVMDHWRSLMGERIIDVSYETLVGDPEPVLRRVVEAVGLPWEEGLLDRGADEGGIRTASVWQARQPVHGQSVARWQRYEAMAPGFFRALGELRE